jgi:quercetin dioxygenase-like cupin family protein
MYVIPASPPTKTPSERCSGDVWSELIVDPVEGDQRMVVGRVRFAPGSRTAWHSHARGQFLHVLAGVALIQSRGGDIIEVHAGQTVYTPPNEEHWHGAAPGSFMEHLAMIELGDNPATSNTWLEPVTDDEYGGGPR